MSNTDIQLEIRKLFQKLPKNIQYNEWKWMERQIFDKRPIKASPLRELGHVQKTFTDVSEVVTYLQKQGYTHANRSNVHKVLRGERKTAYDHKIWYD